MTISRFAQTAAIAAITSLALADTAIAQNSAIEDGNTQFFAALHLREEGEIAQALAMAEAEALRGDVRAAVLAAHMLQSGEAGRTDFTRAVQLYRMAAAADDPDALLHLGLLARDGRAGLNTANAVEFFSRAAAFGRMEARYELGLLHLDDTSAHFDAARGLGLLRQAAAEGFGPAQHDLGVFLAKGLGGREHLDEAAQWLSLAVNSADADADTAYAAGVVIAESGGGRSAEDLLRAAADQGHAEAAADLGWLLYANAAASGRETAEAVSWLRRAAISGDAVGRFRLAWALAEGRGAARNLEEAYRWLLLAEAAGLSDALGQGGPPQRLRLMLEDQLDEATLDRAMRGVLDDIENTHLGEDASG